ncbi:MAG: hypothetical protein ABEI78_00070 [Candidatus Nanohaloarchaea archaeon]
MSKTLLMMLLSVLTLAVYALNVVFVYMTSTSSRRDLKWFYPFSLSFALIAIAQFTYTVGLVQQVTLPFFSKVGNLITLNNLLYITAGISAIFFIKSLKFEEKQ